MATSTQRSSRFDLSIVEGPIGRAVWRLAWPTMLQNMIAGLQGIIDHAMVGHMVGYTGNAAIGVAWQIIIVVIVFVGSLFTGMGILVARYAGRGDAATVDRVVYQCFLAGILLSIALGLAGTLLAPWLLDLVRAAPEVQAEALPFLRVMFLGIVGMMNFFMLTGAMRAAGDARTPLRLGVAMTALTITFNVLLIPRLGTVGAAAGTVASSVLVSLVGIFLLCRPGAVVQLRPGAGWRPDLGILRELFRFGLPAGAQGIAMNIGGLLLLRFIGSVTDSAAAQAAYAIGYTELFSLITWASVGLMGAAATIAGQNLGAGRPDRVVAGARVAARGGLVLALVVGAAFTFVPRALLGLFGMEDPTVLAIGTQLLHFLAVSGLFVTVALSYTGALQGAGDTRSPLYISLVSQVAVPVGFCAVAQALGRLEPAVIWSAIVLGHVCRCLLSVGRFRQRRWEGIEVRVAAAPTAR